VRALGLDLPRAGVVQVSMNVEDWEAAALHEIFARIEEEAAQHGAEVAGSELVGLMPAGAAAAAAGAMLRIEGFDASHVLELRLSEFEPPAQR
jgi:glutamate formiminotransferase